MDGQEQTRHIDWQKGAAIIICVTAGAYGLWLLLRYALNIAMPFLLAWLLAQVIRPIVRRLCDRRRIPRRLVAGGLVILFVGGTVFLTVRGIRRGVDELGRLVAELAADTDGLVAAVEYALERAHSLSTRLPFLRHFEDMSGYEAFCAKLDGLVEASVGHIVEAVSARLPDAAMAVAGWLPEALIFTVVMLIACYYFSADDGHMGRAVGKALRRILPASWQDALPPLKRRLQRMGGRYARQYARVYLLLGLITFLEMFIGLSLLGIRYAFILAWVIALIDFLPLLGTGAVLLPWATVSCLLGETKLGIGLLILYGVSTILRQIIEPRLISRGLGLHPLLSLVAMYAGLRLFGFGGMIFLPLLVGVVYSMVRNEA